MKLIYTDTGKPVQLGDVFLLDGQQVTVKFFREPHKPSSEGKVSVQYSGETGQHEYYVSIIGAKWIDREDQNPLITSRDAEARLIGLITDRAMEIVMRHGYHVDRLRLEMDITAIHNNDCPLDLERLLAAPETDFVHDVFGLIANMNRETFRLDNLFWPRYAKEQ